MNLDSIVKLVCTFGLSLVISVIFLDQNRKLVEKYDGLQRAHMEQPEKNTERYLLFIERQNKVLKGLTDSVVKMNDKMDSFDKRLGKLEDNATVGGA